MKATKILALILALALAVCAFAACGDKTDDENLNANDQNEQGELNSTPEESGTIIMGTQIGFPPFEVFDDNAEPAGFDIDLSNMIADAAGKELQIENMDFGGLIAALQSGKIDFAAAGMSVNEQRKQSVDFSKPYYSSRQVIVVPADSAIAAKEDLLGKVVAVQEGTTGDDMVREFKETENGEPKDNTVSFKLNADVAMEVLNGRADAFVLDEEPSKAIVAQNEGKLKILDVEFGTEEYAIAVKKGNTELLDIINGVIDQMMSDGTYDAMIAEYFPDRAVEAEGELTPDELEGQVEQPVEDAIDQLAEDVDANADAAADAADAAADAAAE